MKSFLKIILTAASVLLLSSCSGREAYSATVFMMDTVFGINVYGEEETVSELISKGEELDEKVLSRFSANSLLHAYNAGESAVDGFDLERVLADCDELRVRSGGAFDVRLGALSDLWNIDGAAEGECDLKVPSEDEISAALEDKSITDLGSVGKGIYLDEAYLILEESGTGGAVISAGGSVLVYGSKYDKSPFRVGIKDPFGGENYATIETSRTVFISTSGSYERYAEVAGIRYHHILDPSTGYPAWLDEYSSGELCPVSVTVLAGSGFISDALSTALFVLGPEDGMKLAEEYDADVIFIMSDGQAIVSRGIIEKDPENRIYTY